MLYRKNFILFESPEKNNSVSLKVEKPPIPKKTIFPEARQNQESTEDIYQIPSNITTNPGKPFNLPILSVPKRPESDYIQYDDIYEHYLTPTNSSGGTSERNNSITSITSSEKEWSTAEEDHIYEDLDELLDKRKIGNNIDDSDIPYIDEEETKELQSSEQKIEPPKLLAFPSKLSLPYSLPNKSDQNQKNKKPIATKSLSDIQPPQYPAPDLPKKVHSFEKRKSSIKEKIQNLPKKLLSFVSSNKKNTEKINK
jgi:hypothetical protein